MRHTFLALIVATIVVISDGFTSAENIQIIDNRRLRVSARVQEERGFDALSKLVPNLMGGDDALAKLSKIFVNPGTKFKIADEEVAKMSVLVKKANAENGVTMADDEVAKFAMTFAAAKQTAQLSDAQVLKLSNSIAHSNKLKEAAKVGDDEVVKASELFKKSNAGAIGGALFTDDVGKAFTAAQKEASLSDDQVSQLSKIFSNADIADDVLKLTDDEVNKMMGLIKKANAENGVVLADDELAKFAIAFGSAQKSAKITDGQVLKLSKMIAGSKKVKEAVTVSDDEVAKVSEVFKKANAGALGGAKFTDDELAKISKGFAVAQKEAGISDIQMQRIMQILHLCICEQDIGSIVSVLGITIGGAVIYTVVKLTTKDSASVAPTTTTSVLPLSDSRGYWKHYAPGKWFRQAKISGKINNDREILLLDTGAEVSIMNIHL
ncbi:Eukaryotic/viral aspartic protease, active site [Phytophthora palmivora]|uniref:Eukaryotic/viral aspartic protease, active site n=1 Tax=Phytophthora palmivora TaxID=4796 RepID=A0A2P4YST6_9STRA|nr:Eukaryotic/viral aspartic protease, active site [Phytophthora palmivora]